MTRSLSQRRRAETYQRVAKQRGLTHSLRQLYAFIRDSDRCRGVAQAAMSLRSSEEYGDALTIDAEPLCLSAERGEGFERLARRLPELVASPFAHPSQRKRALLFSLTIEPFDGQIAQLLDFVETAACLGDVRQRDADLRQLAGRRCISRRHLEVPAGSAVSMDAIRRLRRRLRSAICVCRLVGGVVMQRDFSRTIAPIALESLGDAQMQLPHAIPRNRLHENLGDLFMHKREAALLPLSRVVEQPCGDRLGNRELHRRLAS